MIDLNKIKEKINISFNIDKLSYLQNLVPGTVQSEDIQFNIDDFESETAIDLIYNESQIIEHTKKHNILCVDNNLETLSNHHIIIAEDVGGSPIILDLLSGCVLLFWFDFDGKLALLFDDLKSFYDALLMD